MAQDRSAEYRMPVTREAATVTFAEGSRHEVVLFCELGMGVDDLLEGSGPFLPVEQDGRVRLVARSTLAVVTVKPRPKRDADDEFPLHRVDVTVRVRAGAILEGQLAYVPRLERPRTLDFLNGSGRIVTVESSGMAHHIFKDHIASVEER